MLDQDWVALHEVMEQQTVSLAKAGITVRLNARCSILAAANPVYGKYNASKTPHENINLPYSLLSWFDLLFILIDEPNDNKDNLLADHITKLHQFQSISILKDRILDDQTLYAYIQKAKTIQPKIKPDVHQMILDQYIGWRNQYWEDTSS